MKAVLWFVADVEMCLFFLIGFAIIMLVGAFHAEFGFRSWAVWQVGYSLMLLCAFNIGRAFFLVQEFHDLYQAQGQQFRRGNFRHLLLCLGVAVVLLVAAVATSAVIF